MMRLVLILILALSGLVQVQAQTDSEREELIIVALEALMSTSSERGLALVQKVLSDDHSNRVKSRALFVLSQYNLPEAGEVLIDFAHNANPELQSEAIRMIGIGGNRETLAALSGIYAAGDDDVKEQVLQAYMIAGDEQAVYQLAANATTEKEFDDAIHMLGVMGAVEELRLLSDSNGGSESLIKAYAISGDLDGLLALAQSTDDPDLKLKAISQIGIIGSDRAGDALVDFYRNADGNKDIKEAALHGMMVASHEQGLLELYRSADNLDDKRKLLRTLGLIGGDAALDAIDDALDGRQP